MNQELFNQAYLSNQHWVLAVQIIASVLTLLFVLWQIFINKRLKELQDYVAVSFVPAITPNGGQIQIFNAGKINLYLHKFEVGQISHTFSKSRLLAVGGSERNFYGVPVSLNPVNTEMEIRLYLTDESNKKYLATGGYILDALAVPQPVLAPPEGGTPPVQIPALQLNLRAWTYRTEKFEWNI